MVYFLFFNLFIGSIKLIEDIRSNGCGSLDLQLTGIYTSSCQRKGHGYICQYEGKVQNQFIWINLH